MDFPYGEQRWPKGYGRVFDGAPPTERKPVGSAGSPHRA